MMSEGTVSELCRVLQKQGYRGDAVSVFADSLAYITYLESQLAARNQAAEAMGVLERLVPREPEQLVMSLKGDEYVIWDADDFGALCDVGAAEPSLIEAVLMAGGES